MGRARFTKKVMSEVDREFDVVIIGAGVAGALVAWRLVADKAHKPELLAAWRTYLANAENAQAADLWFIYDRIRDVEKAILAASCDGARSAGAAAVERIRAEADEFRRSKSPAAPAAK